MPNPVALATKEEEDRRAWVTAHHEVVRLIKDCFGDRFSNNEIFDRLKISRRTGYRALGNDERIGKAPGRKPKITDETLREMVEYIEAGGCGDVGNVWKHLADKFAPDCNPKTVQDAVKKSGLKNYRDTVKLEPLLDVSIAEDGQLIQPTPDAAQDVEQHVPQVHAEHQSVIDPSFQTSPIDTLRTAIESAPENHVRWVLQDLCANVPDAARIAANYLCPYVAPPPLQQQPLGAMGTSLHPHMHGAMPADMLPAGRRRRLAFCRRCNKQYDRLENTMETRECLYHKGSPQKIAPDAAANPAQAPESYIWSCCGGNGAVRGCCRAMHTTKKKRRYGKKRDAEAAGLDAEEEGGEDGEDGGEGEETMLDAGADANIDVALRDVAAPGVLTQMAQLGQIGAEGMGGGLGGLEEANAQAHGEAQASHEMLAV